MGGQPVKEGDRIESVYGYYKQVEYYETRNKKVLDRNRYEVPNRSLAWPGQKELLDKYCVSVEEITSELAEIIFDVDEQERINRLDNPTKSCRVTCSAIDNYVIVKSILSNKNVQCKYSSEHQTHEVAREIMYHITNVAKNVELKLTNYDWHMIQEHGDLGRIPPKLFCDLINLGDTYLPETDGLYDVARLYDLPYKDLEDTLVKEKNIMLFDVNMTFMMSHQSGRARRDYEYSDDESSLSL